MCNHTYTQDKLLKNFPRVYTYSVSDTGERSPRPIRTDGLEFLPAELCIRVVKAE